MSNKSNLDSYDNVEALQLHSLSNEEMQAYIDAKLKSAESNCKFIKDYVYTGTPLQICEIGSGNSKLLYTLEKDNILGGGTVMRLAAAAMKWPISSVKF